MSDKRVRKYLQVGTMECMLLCMGVALLIGIGFFTLGFWRMLLLAVLLLIGMFIGGVTNKREMMSDISNKLFPARAQQAARNLQLADQVRRTVNSKDFDDEPEEEPAAGEPADQAEEAVQEAAGAFADLTEEAKETVQEAAESAAYTLESLDDQAQEAAAEVKEAVKDAAEAAENFAEEKAQEISEAAEEAADAVEEGAKKAAGAAGEAAAGLFEQES